jgi:hypothetical protein
MDEVPLHFQTDYFGQTTVHPLGLVVMLALGAATVFLPRRWALLPMLALMCFVPMSQRVIVGGMDFTFLRLIILFGWARVLLMREYRHFAWRWMDTAMVAWALATLALGPRTSGGDTAAFIKYLGHTYNALGGYFLCRCLVRGWDEVALIARTFIVLSVPVAAAFLLEFRTGRNLFSVFGGVPEITNVRDGRLRCQGAFSHPILAGCFWASVLPLMAAQAWRGWRFGALVGFVAGVAIVGLCASSTPVFTLVAGTVGAVVALFHERTRKWLVRFAVVGLVFLHFAREAPVWHLLTRVTVVGGSSGHHRYRLIDAAIEHANEWWMAGSTAGTDHWGRGLFDVTNYYLAQCLRGGLPLLVLFALLLWAGFSSAAKARRRVRADFGKVILAAALGISLFQHAASFIGVTYFGQIVLLWYLLLAMIGSVEARSVRDARAAEQARRIAERADEELGEMEWPYPEEPERAPVPTRVPIPDEVLVGEALGIRAKPDCDVATRWTIPWTRLAQMFGR